MKFLLLISYFRTIFYDIISVFSRFFLSSFLYCFCLIFGLCCKLLNLPHSRNPGTPNHFQKPTFGEFFEFEASEPTNHFSTSENPPTTKTTKTRLLSDVKLYNWAHDSIIYETYFGIRIKGKKQINEGTRCSIRSYACQHR